MLLSPTLFSTEQDHGGLRFTIHMSYEYIILIKKII